MFEKLRISTFACVDIVVLTTDITFLICGNFKNVVAITPIDILGVSCETCCVNQEKTEIYANIRVNKDNLNITSMSVLITKLTR